MVRFRGGDLDVMTLHCFPSLENFVQPPVPEDQTDYIIDAHNKVYCDVFDPFLVQSNATYCFHILHHATKWNQIWS